MRPGSLGFQDAIGGYARLLMLDRRIEFANPQGALLVGLSEIDRNLLQRCLERRPGAWEDFVDRFLGLVVHVIHHTAQSRSVRISRADVEDLASDVFLAIIDDDFGVLRRF